MSAMFLGLHLFVKHRLSDNITWVSSSIYQLRLTYASPSYSVLQPLSSVTRYVFDLVMRLCTENASADFLNLHGAFSPSNFDLKDDIVTNCDHRMVPE